jgi:hypothetical protein
MPVKHIDFTLIINKVKPLAGQNKWGRRLPHRRPLVTEVTDVHREVNTLIMHKKNKNANSRRTIYEEISKGLVCVRLSNI